MKVLIIEDEHFAAEKLEQMVLEINPSISVAAKTGSIKESVKWLMNNSVDLIFLDIQLSDGISFSIFEQVMINTPVIFTTAYDQYAIKAFQLNSIAYLLKPIRRIELEESLQKYQTLKSAFSIDFETLLANIQGREPDYKKRFLIQLGEKIRKVEIGEIAYFFVLEKAVYLRTFQGKSYPVDYTLDKLESLINPEKFFRINRKYIVSIESINNMVAYSRSRVKLELIPVADDERDTIVSIDRSGDFKKWLNA
ncbi:LytR/AlgR family response regulator transcription factor [Saccharicrinis sp. FJH54]|uniref:LytR/AlgR family response regulator transcription factor n=1 Tax=Saccharicrinis sp. FJH54 TaxID=3344665 RepID=UPI0035D461BD